MWTLTGHSIYWVSATVGRLVLAKMWLMAHHPLQYPDQDGHGPPSQEIRDRLFATSVEVIEFSTLLESNENTAKWGWLFRTYMQWHAVALVLSELCVRPPGADYDRAWKAVETVYDERVLRNPRNQKGMLWKPMRQLMARAQTIRNKYRMNHVGATQAATAPNGTPSEALNGGPLAEGGDEDHLFCRHGSIRGHAEVFGLDFDDEPTQPNSTASQNPTSATLQSQQMGQTPLQPDFMDENINQWLQQEQGGAQNLETLNWSGWNLGTLNIGDFPMSVPLTDQFVPMEGVQEWY